MKLIRYLAILLLLPTLCFASIYSPGQSLNSVVTEIGTAKSVLLITDAQSLTANLVTPASLQVIVLQGGSITTGAFTITIGNFDAGLYQVFNGNVVFLQGAVKEVPPRWWGALADGVNDDAPAINSAGLSIDSGTVRMPAGVYLCKHTVIFQKFLNYVGDRSTVANNTTPVHVDNMGTIIYQSPELYTTDTLSGGVLVYIPGGDMLISGITFVGTAGVNTNPSTGIQWGNSISGRTHEGMDWNVSGIEMVNCRFVSFKTAWEVNNLNDSYFDVGFESNPTTIHLGNENALRDVYIDFTMNSPVFYNSVYTFTFANAPATHNASYRVKINGGSWITNLETSQERFISYLPLTKAPNIDFSVTAFDVQATAYQNKYLMVLGGIYDNAKQNWSLSNSTMKGALISAYRGAGSTVPANIRIAHNLLADSFIELGEVPKAFVDSNVMDNVGVSVSDSSVNDSIMWSNNIGLTNIPIRGRVFSMVGHTFTQIGSPNTNGSMVYCTDCTVAIPVTDGGTGCIAKRLNGVWVGI